MYKSIEMGEHLSSQQQKPMPLSYFGKESFILLAFSRTQISSGGVSISNHSLIFKIFDD
jgi:hypothetical protein